MHAGGPIKGPWGAQAAGLRPPARATRGSSVARSPAQRPTGYYGTPMPPPSGTIGLGPHKPGRGDPDVLRTEIVTLVWQRKLQTNLNVEHYLTAGDWLAISSSYEAGVLAVAKREVLLGDVYKSEASLTYLNAVLITARMGENQDIHDLNSQTCLKRLNDIKSTIKSMRAKTNYPHTGKVSLYPDDIEEFKKQYPHIWNIAYKMGPPVESQISPGRLHQVYINLPQRQTHATLVGGNGNWGRQRAQAQVIERAVPRQDLHMQQMQQVLQAFQHMMSNMRGNVGADDEVPITIMGPATGQNGTPGAAARNAGIAAPGAAGIAAASLETLA